MYSLCLSDWLALTIEEQAKEWSLKIFNDEDMQNQGQVTSGHFALVFLTFFINTCNTLK